MPSANNEGDGLAAIPFAKPLILHIMKHYCIIAKCDPYNARRHHHGERVVRYDGATPVEWIHCGESFDSLREANERLFSMAKEAAGHFFDNWGLAVIHGNRYFIECATHKDGARCFSEDTMTYTVSEWPDE